MRRRTTAMLVASVALVVLCVARDRVAAWWPDGHALVTDAALRILPDDVPAFFRSSARALALHASMPDVWTESGLPRLRATERHGHYVDLELLAGHPLPPTRAEFAALCGRLGVAPEAVGTLPYGATETYERLVVAFAVWRARPDDEATRAGVVFAGGILAHYAADAAQPLHATVHFDGRVRADGSSPRSGVHYKVDALPLTAGVTVADVAAVSGSVVPADAWEAIVGAVTAAFGLVDRVYELEPALPDARALRATEVSPEVAAFALERLSAAARLVATLWLSAWRASAGVKLPEWFTPFAGRLDGDAPPTGGCAPSVR